MREDNCDSCRYSSLGASEEPCVTCSWFPPAQRPIHWQPRVSIDDATPAEWDAASVSIRWHGNYKPVTIKTDGQEWPIPGTVPAHDPVQRPAHYTAGAIECIDYMEDVLSRDEFIGYLRGQVIKYQHRLRHKGNPAQDAGKLAWYAQRLASKLETASE